MKVKVLSAEELTTIGVGAPRKVYFPESVGELRSLLREDFPVIGGGSNSVLSDKETPLVSTIFLKNVEFKGNQITLGAGVKLSQILKLQQKKGFSLFEFLAGIPRATVGGLIAQNAGAFGKEVKDFLVSVTYMERETGEIKIMKREEIIHTFGYRKTPFPEKGVVLYAVFNIKPAQFIKEAIRKFVMLRLSKQPPFYLRTAGSTFKNPSSQSAGKLLDVAGLRGISVGNLEFSRHHANFIINKGKSRYDDLVTLVDIARERVKKLFKVDLELEIKIL